MSQTEGTELPEFSEHVAGNAGEYRDRLVDFVIGQGIALEFKESIAPALGVSCGGKIALLPGQSSAEESQPWCMNWRTYVVFRVMLRSGCEGASSLDLRILDTT